MVRKIRVDLANRLEHFCKGGRVHRDLMPSNVAHVLFLWALLGLENSVAIGENYGKKRPSTGYCPPKMARVLLDRVKGVNREEEGDRNGAKVMYCD